MYDDLIDALKGTGIPTAEFEWQTRPMNDYITIAPEGEGDSLDADGQKCLATEEGAVHLFMHGRNPDEIQAVEEALESVCGAAYYKASEQYEGQYGLVHIEWVYSLEA